MRKLNLNNTVTIINQEKVVNWLDARNRAELGDKVDAISHMIGRKGERFPEFVLSQSVKELVGQKLFQEIECDVIQFMFPTQELYYIGILPSDVKLVKKEKANLVK